MDIKDFESFFNDKNKPTHAEINNVINSIKMPNTNLVKILFRIITEKEAIIKEQDEAIFQLKRDLATEKMTYHPSLVNPEYASILQYAKQSPHYYDEASKVAYEILSAIQNKGKGNGQELLHNPSADTGRHEQAQNGNEGNEKHEYAKVPEVPITGDEHDVKSKHEDGEEKNQKSRYEVKEPTSETPPSNTSKSNKIIFKNK